MKLNLQSLIKNKNNDLPTLRNFKCWCNAPLLFLKYADREKIEFTIRIVNSKESAALNARYRKKAGPTNVLSFPYQMIDEYCSMLRDIKSGKAILIGGDIILCAPVIRREAKEQQKTLMEHYAHLTVHGVLHILGYDHSNVRNAKIMEELEDEILATTD